MCGAIGSEVTDLLEKEEDMKNDVNEESYGIGILQ
jgi:hypothetical protein